MPSSRRVSEVVVRDGAIAHQQKSDPLVWWLGVVVALLITTLLVGVLYALLNGISTSRAPRTAFEARLVILERAVQDYPQSGEAWRDYISVLAAAGDYRGAERALEAARKNVKGFETGPVAVGELAMLWTSERYKETASRSEVLYKDQMKLRDKWEKEMRGKGRKVIGADIEPEVVVEILVYSARAYGATKDWDTAIEKLSAALELDPQAADIMALRGDAFVQIKEYDKARADYKGALKYIPDYEPALAALKDLEAK